MTADSKHTGCMCCTLSSELQQRAQSAGLGYGCFCGAVGLTMPIIGSFYQPWIFLPALGLLLDFPRPF